MHNYQIFLKKFKNAVADAGRDINEITIIAVSKRKSFEEISKVIELGHKSFGENQIQEVENKWNNFQTSNKHVNLHYIGTIQSRKTEAIFSSCDYIHSIDRLKIVEQIKKYEDQQNCIKKYFIQINTGNETQKSGVLLDKSENFIDLCINKYNLNVSGLMCLPPLNENPEPHFKTLKKIADNFRLPYLSMGMSSDYETAIKCGSTHIRIGTLIFGERD